MNETPMPHELRTQLNEELRAWDELNKKLTELESQMKLVCGQLEETINLFMNIQTPVTEDEVGEHLANLEKENAQICKECGSTLVDDGYGEMNACVNCA